MIDEKINIIETPEISLDDRIGAIQLKGRIPTHVAIIMDGNGRWAKQRGLQREDGHEMGVKAVKRVVEIASELGVRVLTLYTFSVENWNRPLKEIKALMSLLSRSTIQEIDDLMEKDVRLIVTGRLNELPLAQRKALQMAIDRTSSNSGLTLNLALSYGGRTEILDAVREICNEALAGRLSPDDIDEKQFSKYLYTAQLPDPDLLIRTSGEMRLSNFLLWQTSYTELYMCEILWPDFGPQDFLDAIHEYQKRDRRYGRAPH
ncbi:MAG: isoprenyl transferase [candidate division Zixibacteria bacterium]|nr:isoprenyl transferase [candidate division Zixibacteria bacterium]